MADRLLVLDTASLYFRAFHGVPDTLRAPNGAPVNAVRGLLDMIARLVTDFEPTHLVACWDDDWRPAWRVELIPSYKAHRVAATVAGINSEDTPAGLLAQLPLIREVLTALNLTVLGVAGYEADDVIGTLAAQAAGPVDIVTGDRDLFQLVNDKCDVRVLYTARGMSRLEIVTDATVVSKYGILPSQYADFAALRGDPSDGLPGVAGIGDKTARNLLQEFIDLNGIVAAAGDPTSSMSATTRSKVSAASDYLVVAPTVVRVVSDLDLAAFNAAIRPLDPEHMDRIKRLVAEWNLGGSARRVLQALGNNADAG